MPRVLRVDVGPRGLGILLALLQLSLAAASLAQAPDASTEEPSESRGERRGVTGAGEDTARDAESEQEIAIDAEGSMEVPDRLEGRRGWSIQGDVRGLAAWAELDERDGELLGETEVLVRVRQGASRSLSERWRIGSRVSASCSSAGCRLDRLFDEGFATDPNRALDIDEAFVHWYRSDRYDLAFGRLQTRFITKGGVFAKSLDRNDSNNTRITWTDGVHGTRHYRNGLETHLILQYNPEDGPAQLLREPLDFSSEKSRVSAFTSLVSERPVAVLTQWAVDLSYFPSALKKDGPIEGSRLEDYWGIVARIAGRLPRRAEGRRVRFSAEAGYAPNTPTRAGVGLPGEGDTGGSAVAVTLSLMDLLPRHSIGVNLARTGAGWLLSPQYNRNEELFEVRYVWTAGDHLTFDARVRRRQDLDAFVDTARKREELDVFLRLTWRFQRQRPALLP
jgi:hypothetical protein